MFAAIIAENLKKRFRAVRGSHSGDTETVSHGYCFFDIYNTPCKKRIILPVMIMKIT